MDSQKSMTFAWDLGLSHVIFEVDCQIVVKSANSSNLSGNELSSLIFYIQSLLQGSLGWNVS